MKAFWKTNGDVRTCEMHIPFNLVNVQTGNGYYEDVMARFWQAERHARGCADVAYTIKMLLTKPFHWRTTFFSYHIIETFVLSALIPWAIIGSTIKDFAVVFMDMPENIVDSYWIQSVINFSSFSFVFTYTASYLFFRYASKILFGTKPAPLWRILEFPIMFFVTLFTMIVPTFIIAAFKVMLNKS